MRSLARRLAVSLLAASGAAACGPAVHTAPTTPPAPARPLATALAARPDATNLLPPVVAFQRGLMPLEATGIPAFLQAHPEWDGRGVLIAILDSGIDPGVDGLQTTTTGEPKIADLRDFSGEGRVALAPVTPLGDSVTVGGRTVAGMGRLRGINMTGPWYGGVLREIPLGEIPAADVNWNNVVGDTLPVFVTRATDGWVLLADLDGDGSLANERPVHDFRVARERFGWAAPGRTPALTFTADLAEVDGAPVLDLFFDTSGHGTHVAGIAAGHGILGADGFDGVAPGAQLLGLKIANDAQGGISTTGSMLRALDYAIRTAAARQRPLVVNMSFGVGNERGEEGTARIDALIDSVLAEHPDVVFSISAGNDGPGVSTLGFPGSAARALSVGATFPRVFLSRQPTPGLDPIAYFSSRGGEVARPDLLTPGVAFSTVPRWNFGDEVKGGTSMAAPHAAGLAALLVSGLAATGRPVDARRIRQALMATAQPLEGLTALDQGAGVPNVGRAWRWLEGNYAWIPLAADAVGPAGHGNAAFRGEGLAPGDTTQQFLLHLPAGTKLPLAVTLRSDAPWLGAPSAYDFSRWEGGVTVTYHAAQLQAPGTYVGTVTVWGADTMAGPLARLVNTVVVPAAPEGEVALPVAALTAGHERRVTFAAQEGRPFAVRVASGAPKDVVRAWLHEPGGQPFRNGNEQEGAAGDEAARFEVEAQDVVPGLYEVVAAAPPIANSSAGIAVHRSPLGLFADLRDGAPLVALVNHTAAPVTATVAAAVVGGAREEVLTGAGADTGSLAFELPAWVRRVEVDVRMPATDWARFTDFGVTLENADGSQIGQAPLNYAFGRLEAELPRQRAAGTATLKLYPGWADPGSAARWTLTARVRLYGDSAQRAPLAVAGNATVTIPAGTPESVRFAAPASPWPLPAGFVPLLGYTVTAGDGTPWRLTAPLVRARAPLMR